MRGRSELGTPTSFHARCALAKQFESTMVLINKYALEILNGYEYRRLARYGDQTPDALLPGGDPAVFKQEGAQAERQQRWVTAHVASKH